MRVGMVSPYSLSVPGGVQGQIMGLARELRRMGIECRVLAPCDGPPPDTFVTPLGNSLPTSANGSVAPLAPDPSAVLRTIRALRDEEFDVLHLHEPFAPGPPQTATLLHPAPIIATFHAAGDSAAYRYLKGPIKAAAKNVVHWVAVSKDAADLVHRSLGGTYEILFNGVEVDAYRAAEPWPASGPTILFCGRHEERKGLDVLLRAMAAMPADTRLWVAGTGPDTERLRREHSADRRVEFIGQISDAEKFRRLRGAHVFCAPALRGESFGVVLLEAMAAGTPVVASGIDGYRNVATHDVDALLVPPGDPMALAAALRQALGDEPLRDRLVARGAARADEYSMARLAALYAKRYAWLAALVKPTPVLPNAAGKARMMTRSAVETLSGVLKGR
jgi:phosphatidyl-myo-inositol alpha-mannosyltransferase